MADKSIIWDNRVFQFCPYIVVTLTNPDYTVCLSKTRMATTIVIAAIFVTYLLWKCIRVWRFMARCWASWPPWMNYYHALDLTFKWMSGYGEPNIYWAYVFVLLVALIIVVDCPIYLGRKLGIIAECAPRDESPWTPSFPAEASTKNIR